MFDEEPAVPGAPAWAVTFGDMMSLLLTFFIMLVSLGSLEQNEKYQSMLNAIRGEFGHPTVSWSWLPDDVYPPQASLVQLISSRRARRSSLLESASNSTGRRGTSGAP